jgi:hypothetical protein
VEDVVDPFDRAPRDIELRKVPFEEFHVREMGQVVALAGNEAVDDTNALAAANELLGEM